MNKKLRKTGTAAGVLCGSFILAYAISRMLFTQSVTTDLTKKKIFQFDLSAESMRAEIGPGDFFEVAPIVNNTATEEMYVFIEAEMPDFEDDPLYTFEPGENWALVSSVGGTEVYAYGGDELSVVYPGESTEALTDRMTMKNISNAEFAGIDDINVTITGWAIDTNGVSADPAAVWTEIEAIR